MLTASELSRYAKQIILPEIGKNGQERLQAAKVLVVGAGGLGCPVLQYLTAAGVGHIGIADGDVVDVSNLQRQVLYSGTDIGSNKAVVAEARMKALNPHVQFRVFPHFVDTTNILDIMSGYDIIVDGSDNFSTRYLINDACVIAGKPLVSGAIYKFEGQVSVFNYLGGPTYRCLFPEPPSAEDAPNCSDIGVIATLPGIVGTIQANEVIKMLTGIGEVLSGRLLVLDSLTMNTHFFRFNPVAANKTLIELGTYEQVCINEPAEISYQQVTEMLKHPANTLLIDVREPNEHTGGNIGGINIPLSQFASGMAAIDPSAIAILYCASGIRSRKAAKMLLAHGYSRVFSLAGGVNGLPIE